MTELTSFDHAATLLELLFPNEPYWESFLISLTEGCAEGYEKLTSYYTYDETYIDYDELQAFAVSYGQDKMSAVEIEHTFSSFHDGLRGYDRFGLHSRIDLVLSNFAQDDVQIDSVLIEKIKKVALQARHQVRAAEMVLHRSHKMLKILREKLSLSQSKGSRLKGG